MMTSGQPFLPLIIFLAAAKSLGCETQVSCYTTALPALPRTPGPEETLPISSYILLVPHERSWQLFPTDPCAILITKYFPFITK